MRNLLKYDFKYTWRIWWIAAVASVAATFLGCISIRRSICYPEIGESPLTKSVQGVLDGLSVSGIIVYILALALFIFLIELVVMYRYYKNLFTDEGYLTFTLPVKEDTILISKTISGFLWYLITTVAVLVLAGVGILFSIRCYGTDWGDVFIGIGHAIKQFNFETEGYAPLYLLEVILIIVFGCTFNILLGYVSITIGSIIAKKNKLLAAIGIYFAICIVFSIFCNVMGLVGIFNFDAATNLAASKMIAVMLLLVMLFLAAVSAIAYFCNVQLLKKKLNLA